jgi:tetratricopeptide (TPR) repeat protein
MGSSNNHGHRAAQQARREQVVAQMKAERRLELARRDNEATIELARWVSLATRVEPNLLRRARLRFMARSSASLEADLWFGPLVQTRGANFILLYPDITGRLREELAADRQKLMRAWELVRKTHGYLPELARLEERLTWLALKGGPGLERRIDVLLRPVIKALLDGNREGLARWAVSALPRLPEQARTKTTKLLRMISEAQLYGGWTSLLTASGDESQSETLTEEERNLLIRTLEQSDVGIQLKGDAIEVCEPPPEGARIIPVPSTRPRVLDLTWHQNGERKQQRLTWQPGSGASVADVPLPVSINTLAGDSYHLLWENEVVEELREKAKPFLVYLSYRDHGFAGLGLWLGNNRVLTTERTYDKSLSARDIKSSLSELMCHFPLLPNSEHYRTNPPRVIESKGPPEFSEATMILRIETPTVRGIEPARLNPRLAVAGKSLVALGHSPHKPEGTWNRFVMTADRSNGYWELKPAANLSSEDLKSWSGSPLMDSETGEVAGIFCLNAASQAYLRIIEPHLLISAWNVPHLRNPNFIGREKELADLRDSLIASNSGALVQPRIIQGLGGAGKSQLAAEYAYRHSADYKVVWWLRSEEPATLVNDYARLAAELYLPEKDASEQRVVVEAVKEWLRQNRGWLLIFDNAPDADSVRDYIPRGGSGHVIITSRNPNWSGIASPLRIGALTETEAVQFLINRTGQKDEATAAALAAALGYLPLALEQAAAFIEASGQTLSHYLDLFRVRGEELLKRGEPSTDYPDTVATTWNASFQRVESENPAAADFLRLLSFFAPDDIPLQIIKDGAKHLPESLASTVAGSIALDKALASLRRYSFIEMKTESVSLHRLVQTVTQDQMDEDSVREWTEAAVRILDEAFPNNSDDVRTWGICSQLLPHALAALSKVESLGLDADAPANLLNNAGVYLFGRAEFIQASVLFERALAIDEARLGPNHPNIAFRLNSLGLVQQELGDHTRAKAYYERALTISESSLGPDHPNMAIYLNNLGGVLKDLGDFEVAKALYERAIAIDEAALGPDHPHVAIDLNNLGLVLESQGDLTGAKALFERAIALGEAAFGANHPTVAIRLNNLGEVMKAQGDLTGAKALYERALRIFREFLGDDHPNTKMVQNNLRMLRRRHK